MKIWRVRFDLCTYLKLYVLTKAFVSYLLCFLLLRPAFCLFLVSSLPLPFFLFPFFLFFLFNSLFPSPYLHLLYHISLMLLSFFSVSSSFFSIHFYCLCHYPFILFPFCHLRSLITIYYLLSIFDLFSNISSILTLCCKFF